MFTNLVSGCDLSDSASRRTWFIVVTGSGQHSPMNVPKIKPAVLEYLKEHGYRCMKPTKFIF